MSENKLGKHEEGWDFKWALGAVGLCVVFAMVFHIPDYLAHEHFKVWNNITQSYSHGVKRTEFGFGYFYNEVYYTWINLTRDLVFIQQEHFARSLQGTSRPTAPPGVYGVQHDRCVLRV
ncbi:hypothetical protein RRG08_052272 [Elysia crispata]|uniref:Uncharacterized protein n=1 Tax=Elysia crispata TaxID=231223 RepID=A0AAE1DQ47_9GAST|nr:hypothetical protein RRG08_052272 [Elysia crispata]